MNASPTKDTVPSPPKDAAAPAGAAAPPAKKKFQNGWTREIEKLMAEWADKAICYRWMHERTERIFSRKDMGYMFPVIVLSTVGGAANFAMDSVLKDPDQKTYAQLALGGISIMTGIISTIANRLGYASKSEAHHNAALLWGKFQRLIAIELSLHPNERSDCMHFLKMCRSELDRLIEQAPSIPDSVIDACRKEFAAYPTVRKPEIVGDINTTHVFVDTNSRLREIAKEAAITIAQKKGVLKQLVLDDLEPRIGRVIEHSTLPAIRDQLSAELKEHATQATRDAIEAVASGKIRFAPPAAGAGAAAAAAAAGPHQSSAAVDAAKRLAERKLEVDALAKSGVVAEMRRKLAEAGRKYEVPLPGAVVDSEQIIVHVGAEAAPMLVAEAAPMLVAESDSESEYSDDTDKETKV